MFQIAAPMMSWGNDLAREDRPTDGHPRKSAILGLLGAALGKPRVDPWHAQAQAALGFAVVVVRPGSRMMDYHTVLTPEGTRQYDTRRDEVEASDYTVQTHREYLCDAYFIVGLWQEPKGPGAELEAIARALEEPVWELYAGRKSCPFSLPLAPLVIDVPTLEEAFTKYKARMYQPLLPEELQLLVYWEDHPSTSLACAAVSSRNDALVSRSKRLFRARKENQGSLVL